MSWADAPVAGRRPCRRSSPIAGTRRKAPPRSAVAVSPSAPGLAPLTGFSRSGSPSSASSWLAAADEAPLRPIGLARVLRLGVDNQWNTGVPSDCTGETTTRASAPGSVTTTREPLHIQQLRPELALIPWEPLG